MTQRPRIGLVTYGRNEDNWFSLPAEYVDSVRRAGGLPVLLAPGETDLKSWLGSIDALVLPGGGDISPSCYGGEPHAENYKMDADRDGNELDLARHAVAAQLPTLAICRGMQMMHVAFGGKLVPHIPEVVGDLVPHRSPERKPVEHLVTANPESKLAEVMGESRVTVASWHHQATEGITEGFRIAAHSPDGLIEAMELPEHPFLLAVQWHPELTAAKDPSQQRLFDALINAV